ncbi:hypothetical protein CoNPh17_CDS0034 [Staphylococcus phage S-CoN_Ph17]|nr:hypothetical protein CoNPh17_CDS0034 [Staphylococcus phage S-CoN_Ph17]
MCNFVSNIIKSYIIFNILLPYIFSYNLILSSNESNSLFAIPISLFISSTKCRFFLFISVLFASSCSLVSG